MSRLGTETAFEVLAEATALEAHGHDIIHLEIGEPDFETAPHIVESAIQALRDGQHHYTPAPGTEPLRSAIASYIEHNRGIVTTPDEVVVTPGAKPILFYTLLALAETGTEVIYPVPGFPIYESMIRYVGATPVPILLREELNFRPNVQEIISAITPKTRLIILNSPSNPTGSVITCEDLQLLAEYLADRNIMVLSDEIYSRLLFEGEHRTIASFPGMKAKTIILDGFSKTYAMTGWRLGFGVMRGALARSFAKLMINSNSCVSAFTQHAGITALQGDQSAVEHMKTVFRRRRDRVVEKLNQIEGISCRLPRGSFYAFPNVKKVKINSGQLADLLLKDYGVAVLPGTAFGQQAEGYIRISYATSLKTLEAGIERIANAVRRIRNGTLARRLG